MLARRVIPCLDVKEGRVVKGVNFLHLRDAGDPVELAARYDAMGADELVFLDITASHERRDLIVEMAARVAEQVFIPFTVGGGIRTVDDFRKILRAGADKVAVNTAALQRPEILSEAAEQFGRQCVVIAIDPECFAPLDDFIADVEAQCAALLSSPPAAGVDEILLPGEPELRARVEREQSGIPIADATVAELDALCAEAGIAMPEPWSVEE